MIPFDTLTENCERRKTNIEVIEHGVSVIIDRLPGTKYVCWYFTKPVIYEENIIQRIDFYSFISAVGGGLGLFLGFSVISTLNMFYDALHSFTQTKLI